MRFLALSLAACTSLAVLPSFAQNTMQNTMQDTIENTIPSVPIPVDAATVDFSGIWNYTTDNHTVSGVCRSAGAPMVGTLSLTLEDGAVAMEMLSGAVCDPASMCSYTGEINGGNVVVTNTDIVDDENGAVTNTTTLFFSSGENGRGNAVSRYVHPEGYECLWNYNVTLTRPKFVPD